ncbi:hypothetical protein [Brunnivagina elsteri]|nr:hypothetical protein [Calothrix elsteri]
MALIIFLCDESEWDGVRKYVKDAEEQIGKMTCYQHYWTVGNTTKIQVGDRFLIQRTNQNPLGFFCGRKSNCRPKRRAVAIGR